MGFARGGLGLAMVVAGLALAACGGGVSPTSTEIWCDGLCVAVQRCGYQDPTCRSRCVTQRPGLANVSASGAAAEKPCLEEVSCPALAGNDAAWESDLDACWKQAQLSVEATDHVRRFCPGHALAWFDCGYTLSLDDCEHIYGMWTDAVVDRLALCDAKQSCEEFQACESGLFSSL